MFTKLRVFKNCCPLSNLWSHLQKFSRMLTQLHLDRHVTFFTKSSQVSLSKDFRLSDPKKLENDPPQQLPLCYLGGWYVAQMPHLMKFVEIYLGQEFDVLLVQTETDTFSKPAVANKLNEAILKFLQTNTQYDRIIVHGFSSAVYTFAQIMWILEEESKNGGKKGEILNRFKAQIWDSPGVRPALGFGHAVVQDNVMLRNAVITIYDVFLNIFGRSFNQKVKRSNATFHNNGLKCPALCFCSEDDEIIKYKGLVETLEFWRQNGIQVRLKCWKTSRHVTHFRNHAIEYKQALADHLNSVGLLKNPQLLVTKINSKI